MSVGTSNAHNYRQFLKMTKNIDALFVRRVELAVEMCVAEGRAMMEDFRKVRASAESGPPKKEKGSDRTVEETKKKNKERMDAAVKYAEEHSGDTPLTEIGTAWTNRTGMAERGVRPYMNRNPDSIAVGLYHTAWYGPYLEFANNRKHAVIEPIVRKHHATLMEKLQLLCKG